MAPTRISLPVISSAVGQKCKPIFLLPAILGVFIPGEDPESMVRFDTPDSRFRGNDIEGMYGLSPQRTGPRSIAWLPGKRPAGFSFLEVMVALFLLALLSTFAAPRFMTVFEKTADREFRHLTRVLDLLRNESILGNKQFFIVFDPKKQKYHVEQQRKEGGRIEVEYPRILKPRIFPEDFHLENVSLSVRAPSLRAQWMLVETNTPEPVVVRIDNAGFVTPFTLFFSLGKDVWFIQTRDVLGNLEMKALNDA